MRKRKYYCEYTTPTTSGMRNVHRDLTPATTSRKTWRFGSSSEKPIVHLIVHLCKKCAAIWDDCESEGRAEALGS